jgi:hypothetical protein
MGKATTALELRLNTYRDLAGDARPDTAGASCIAEMYFESLQRHCSPALLMRSWHFEHEAARLASKNDLCWRE